MSAQLRSHTLQYSAALLVSRGVTVVFLLVLPAFLSIADYGVLGLVTMAAALSAPLLTLEVAQGLARYYPGASAAERAPLARSAFTFSLATLGGAAMLALMFSDRLTPALLGDVRYLPAFQVAVLFCLVNALFLLVQNQFRWEFRAADFVRISLVYAVAAMGLGVAFAATFADPLLGVLLGQVIGITLALSGGFVRLRYSLGIGLDPAALSRMLRFSGPLVPASLTLFASTYASRLILQDLATLDAVGAFTWASQVASLPALLLLGVQSALTPYVMRHHAEPGCAPLLARGFEAVVALELVICLGLGLLAPDLVRFARYAGYEQAAGLVLPLAPVALMLNIYVFAPGFAIAERTDWQLWVSLVSAIVAVGLNYLLIGPLGGLGAAVASLAAGGTFFLLWFGASQRLYPIPLKVGRLVLFAALFAGLGVAGSRLAAGVVAPILIKLSLVAILAAAAVALRLIDLRALWNAIRPGRAEAVA